MTGSDHLWRDHAACRDLRDPDIFFPEHNPRDKWARPRAVEAAQQICDQCPVRIRCFAEARRNKLTHGIWGGIDLEAAPKARRRVSRPSQARDRHLTVVSDVA